MIYQHLFFRLMYLMLIPDSKVCLKKSERDRSFLIKDCLACSTARDTRSLSAIPVTATLPDTANPMASCYNLNVPKTPLPSKGKCQIMYPSRNYLASQPDSDTSKRPVLSFIYTMPDAIYILVSPLVLETKSILLIHPGLHTIALVEPFKLA